MQRSSYQVAIVGGGVAGCATALALTLQGISEVLVVEASRYDQIRIGESVPPDIRLLLLKLGIWEDFLAQKHQPCLGSCSSWGSDRMGYNDFLFNPHGHGWHLERHRFDAFLARKVQEKGVALCTDTRLEQCLPLTGNGFQLRLKTVIQEPIEVTAQFLVDATGSSALLAKSLGAKRLLLDQLICIIGFFQLSANTDFTHLTMLEAVEHGWWYAAKVPHHQVVVAFASDPEIIKKYALMQKQHWLAYLSETRYIAQALTPGAVIKGEPLTRQVPSFLLDNSVGNSWLAVGDAASTFDPISAQGIYKAFADGLQAAAAIVDFLAGRQDLLEQYHTFISNRFQDYLSNRNYFYNLENRWPQASFWKKRQNKIMVMVSSPIITTG